MPLSAPSQYRVQFLLLGKAVHDPLLAHRGQFLVPAAVEVIAVPPPVGEVREPGFGDKPCLPTEELPVGHLSAACDEAAPLPGILLRIAGPPEEIGGVLLRREAVHLVFEQGQEADLVDPVDQFLPALDAGGIVLI